MIFKFMKFTDFFILDQSYYLIKIRSAFIFISIYGPVFQKPPFIGIFFKKSAAAFSFPGGLVVSILT